MTDNDRELLELAAKAAGYNVKGWINDKLVGWDAITGNEFTGWNPLESDGDAFRLAVRLSIDITFWDGFKQVCCRRHSDRDNFEMHGLVGYGNGTDKEPTAENVRRAIVTAAAEIGRGMV